MPAGPGAADWQRMGSHMSTSMQLAQECLRDEPPQPSEPPQPLEGLEMFAQTIETGEWAPCSLAVGRLLTPLTPAAAPASPTVLRRVKVTFLDSVVRVEHQTGDGERGVAVEVHVER